MAVEALALLLDGGLLPDAYAVYSVVLRLCVVHETDPAVVRALCHVALAILRDPLPPRAAPPSSEPGKAPSLPLPPVPIDPRQVLRDELWAFLLCQTVGADARADTTAVVTHPSFPPAFRSALGRPVDAAVQREAWTAVGKLVQLKTAAAKPNTPWAGSWQQPPVPAAPPLAEGDALPAAAAAPESLEDALAAWAPLLARSSIHCAAAINIDSTNGNEGEGDGGRAAGPNLALAVLLKADLAALPRRLTRASGSAAAPSTDLDEEDSEPPVPPWWPASHAPYVALARSSCPCEFTN